MCWGGACEEVKAECVESEVGGGSFTTNNGGDYNYQQFLTDGQSCTEGRNVVHQWQIQVEMWGWCPLSLEYNAWHQCQAEA